VDGKGEVCVGCGKSAPKTETNYTLISPKYGWRLSREKLPNGSYRAEWRCPNCWREKKISGHMPAVTVPVASTKKR
jgi:hypothetical protein